MRNLKKLRLLFFLAGLLLCTACSKTEFLPEPEGAQIPFQNDATQTVEQLLASSPAKIFYAAWQKSNIANIIKARGSKVMYTVFVPSDVAMQAAGLTASVINQMPETELNNLVMFYTSIGIVNKQDLQGRNDNNMVKTLLEEPNLYVKFYDSKDTNQQYDPYFFRHYLGLKGEQLLINGKETGKLNYIPATNGGVFLIEKTVEKPSKTMLEALEADGRFTLFLESQRLADEIYLDKVGSDIELLFGFRPSEEEIMSSYAYNRFYYKKDWGIEDISYPRPNITISTLFAPTDEAFHQAGFQTINDILEFNARVGDEVRFDDNTFTGVGGYPMDTVYSYHRNFGRIDQPIAPGGDKAVNNSTVFFSNMLSPQLNTYMVSAGGNPTIEYAYQMPLEFSNPNNTTQIKVKGSTFPAATVISGDINTLNGPIHVVDHLFFPKGFKLK